MSELPLSVWPVAQQPSPRQRKDRYVAESNQHPARMIPDLARRVIGTYSKPGDYVFDPLCGIGTTLVESMWLGRFGVGIELEERWVQDARSNIARAGDHGALGSAAVVQGDARRMTALVDPAMHGRFSLALTSPPYGPSLHGNVKAAKSGIRSSDHEYPPDKRHLGNASFGLIEDLQSVLADLAVLLQPGGFAVVVVRPWRSRGQLVDFPGSLSRAGERAGFHLWERHVALLCAVAGDRLTPRGSFFQIDHVRKARARGLPLSVIAHEDVLVFRKPAGDSGSPKVKKPRQS